MKKKIRNIKNWEKQFFRINVVAKHLFLIYMEDTRLLFQGKLDESTIILQYMYVNKTIEYNSVSFYAPARPIHIQISELNINL